MKNTSEPTSVNLSYQEKRYLDIAKIALGYPTRTSLIKDALLFYLREKAQENAVVASIVSELDLDDGEQGNGNKAA